MSLGLVAKTEEARSFMMNSRPSYNRAGSRNEIARRQVAQAWTSWPHAARGPEEYGHLRSRMDAYLGTVHSTVLGDQRGSFIERALKEVMAPLHARPHGQSHDRDALAAALDNLVLAPDGAAPALPSSDPQVAWRTFESTPSALCAALSALAAEGNFVHFIVVTQYLDLADPDRRTPPSSTEVISTLGNPPGLEVSVVIDVLHAFRQRVAGDGP